MRSPHRAQRGDARLCDLVVGGRVAFLFGRSIALGYPLPSPSPLDGGAFVTVQCFCIVARYLVYQVTLVDEEPWDPLRVEAIGALVIPALPARPTFVGGGRFLNV
eukprot:3609435-Pyramimonas_sp.AAC.1